MNTINNALLRGFATEILPTIYPSLPILDGSVIALSNYGMSMYSDHISWAEQAMTANFIPVHNSPFSVQNYGTVQIVEEPTPRFQPIIVEACKVSFNDFYMEKERRNNGMIGVRRVVEEQLRAKVQAWDEKLSAYILYGNPSLGVPGLLNNSGIPTVVSTINFSTASPDAIVSEFIRIASLVPNQTRNLFTPCKMTIPQELHQILSAATYSATTADSVLDVIEKRFSTLAPFAKNGCPLTITSCNAFDADRVMTLLPNSPQEIGSGVWDLEEFYSPDQGESENGTPQGLGSAHRGAFCGVVAKRPQAGLIVNNLIY